MPIEMKIVDGTSNENLVKVDKQNRICTIEASVPPFGESTESRIFRESFSDSSGSTDMKVIGSLVSPVDFTIEPDQMNDRFITNISFEIADANATLSQFGAIGVLANGVNFFYEDDEGEREIDPALNTNWDFVRLCLGNPSFGTGNDAFRGKNVILTNEAFIPVLDLRQVFGFRWGIRLKAGSKQRLVLRIQDDLTGVDSFNAVAYGFDRLEG